MWIITHNTTLGSRKWPLICKRHYYISLYDSCFILIPISLKYVKQTSLPPPPKKKQKKTTQIIFVLPVVIIYRLFWRPHASVVAVNRPHWIRCVYACIQYAHAWTRFHVPLQRCQLPVFIWVQYMFAPFSRFEYVSYNISLSIVIDAITNILHWKTENNFFVDSIELLYFSNDVVFVLVSKLIPCHSKTW